MQEGLAPALAVVGQGEPVRLVPHVLHDAQSGRALVQVDGHAVAGEVQFFEPLGDADKGDFPAQAQFVDGFHGVRELPLAAVDDHHLGERLPFVPQSLVASVHRLFHACEVVRPFHRTDVEFSVVALGRLAVAEDDAGGGGVGAVDVGVVEALHVHGMFLEAQVVHHRFHQPVACSVRVHLLQLGVLVTQGELGVAQRHVEQLLLVPPLWHHTLRPHNVHLHLGQHGSACDVESVPNLGDGRGQHLVVGLVEAAAEFEGLALHHRPVVDAHEVHERGLGVAHQPVHLHVRHSRVDDGALRLELGHGLKLELQALGFLKPEVRRGLGHG